MMKICLVQSNPLFGEISANLRYADALMRDVSSDVYVLPEMFTTGFVSTADATVESEEEGRGLEWMKSKASELDAAVAGSIALKLDDGRCVNRMYFVKPDGEVTFYDKRHLFSYGGEDLRISAGEQRKIVSFRGMRFLLAVCYDLRFPVWLRQSADGCGASPEYDAILISANWPIPRRFAWDTLLRARAIENQCYVIAVNRTGRDLSCEYDGGSVLLDPLGAGLAGVADGVEGTAVGSISVEELSAVRERFPFLRDADSFKLNQK